MQISNNRLVVGKLLAYGLILAGLGVILFFGMGVAAFTDLHLTGEENQIVPLVFCLCLVAGGVGLVCLGRRRGRLIADCKRYFSAIAGGKVRTVEELAAAAGRQTGQVSRNFDKMIGCGYLRGVYLDRRTGRIMILDDACVESKNPSLNDWSSYAQTKKQEMVSVTCEACGGVTHLPSNTVGTCDYCGSHIRS